MGKLYAPAYYQKFVCLAGDCRHSCCIGWEIDVDRRARRKYGRLRGDYAQAIRESIDPDGTPHFRLAPGERCPHLDENGLCRIICTYGEGALCDICREHPRFYHDTVRGREVGVGMACEKACRLILTEDFTVTEIGKAKGHRRPAFDTLPCRDEIYGILLNDSLAYSERLQMVADEYGVVTKSDQAYARLFCSLEYMNEQNRTRFSSASYLDPADTPREIEDYLCRALAYFVFRHLMDAKSEDDLRMSVGFALLCERLICTLAVRENALTLADLSELARTVSEELEYSTENTRKIKYFFF